MEARLEDASWQDLRLPTNEMSTIEKKRLTHILWIGGGTDAGKSSVAQNLAERRGFSVYHYDREDATQMERLARTVPEVSRFLEASLEEHWVQSAPQKMFEFLLFVFPHRFPLVIESLLDRPREKPVIVEGFGLLPELVHPLLSSPHQAIWFVPTEQFKWESMLRRGKPSFASSVSDPGRARSNLFQRDLLLADYYRRQVPAYGYTLIEVDGSQDAGQMTELVEAYFSKYLDTLF